MSQDDTFVIIAVLQPGMVSMRQRLRNLESFTYRS
jgi:hypothetical protein